MIRDISPLSPPQTVVTLQYPAVKTEVRFKGLTVFLQSSGSPTRDERNAKQFSERIAKLQREWENTVLGINYGKDIAEL